MKGVKARCYFYSFLGWLLVTMFRQRMPVTDFHCFAYSVMEGALKRAIFSLSVTWLLFSIIFCHFCFTFSEYCQSSLKEYPDKATNVLTKSSVFPFNNCLALSSFIKDVRPLYFIWWIDYSSITMVCSVRFLKSSRFSSSFSELQSAAVSVNCQILLKWPVTFTIFCWTFWYDLSCCIWQNVWFSSRRIWIWKTLSDRILCYNAVIKISICYVYIKLFQRITYYYNLL